MSSNSPLFHPFLELPSSVTNLVHGNDIWTRNLLVEEIGERSRLNHVIVVQQLSKQLSAERCACKPLAYGTHLS